MTSAALLCLAMAVWQEARGESLEGQVAVAYVVHNRANGDADKYCQVIAKKGQFSWYKKPKSVSKTSKAWVKALTVANTFSRYPDMTRGSKYFHAVYADPKWRRFKRIAVIGNHVFYKGA